MRTQLRIQMVLTGVGIALVGLAWYLWAVDFRRRIGECEVTLLVTGLSMFSGCLAFFIGATWRWQAGRVVSGRYLMGLVPATAVVVTIAYHVLVCLAILAQGHLARLSAGFPGAGRDHFWSIVDTSLFHLVLLLGLGAVVYVATTCWSPPSSVGAPLLSKYQVHLRICLLTVAVAGILSSGIAQVWTEMVRFNAARWRNDPQARPFMLDDLMRRHALVDMSYRDVHHFLGATRETEDIEYCDVPGKGRLFFRFPHQGGHSRVADREVLDIWLGNASTPRSLRFGERWQPVSMSPSCDLETIYRSFRLTPIELSTLPRPEGDRVTVRYGLENVATSELNPRGYFYAPGYAMIGRLQQWLCQPNGRRESAGVRVIPSRAFAPGESFPPFEQELSTFCFQPGTYAWIVELQTVDGRVLQTSQASFVVAD